MIRRDRPTFNHPTRHVGIQLETGLYDAVKKLASSTGVSMNYAIRRALVDMVDAGVVPIGSQEREDEEAPVTEQARPAPIDTGRLQELEREFERLQNELAGLRQETVTNHRTERARTITYDGSRPVRPVGRPRSVPRAPVTRVR